MAKKILILISIWCCAILFSLAGCGAKAPQDGRSSGEAPAAESSHPEQMEKEPPEELSAQDGPDGEVPKEPEEEEPADAATARMRLIPYFREDYPYDTVVVSVTPTEAAYLDGGLGGYVPGNQEEWKEVMGEALSHLQDNLYDAFPSADMIPVTVSWVCGENDYMFTLNKDGSLWGRKGELYKANYIAPEDAAALTGLMMQVYEFLEIRPVEPSQLGDIVRAELVAGGESFVTEEEAALGLLEETLQASSVHPGGTKCPWVYLNLSMRSGENVLLALAADGCRIWYSEGIFYDYGKNPSEIFGLFGINW